MAVQPIPLVPADKPADVGDSPAPKPSRPRMSTRNRLAILPDGVAACAHAVPVLVEHLVWPRAHQQRDGRIPQRQRSSAAHPARHCATRPAHEPARRERGALVCRSGAARLKSARGGAQHRCLGDGTGYGRPRFPRGTLEDAGRPFVDGARQCCAILGAASATARGDRRLFPYCSRSRSPLRPQAVSWTPPGLVRRSIRVDSSRNCRMTSDGDGRQTRELRSPITGRVRTLSTATGASVVPGTAIATRRTRGRTSLGGPSRLISDWPTGGSARDPSLPKRVTRSSGAAASASD